jgi:hypothetical protein
MRIFSTALCLAALTACTHEARGDSPGDFRYTKALSAGAKLEVRNINGGVVAEPASGDALEVVATKSGPDASRVQVVAREEAGTVTVCALWPGEDPSVCRDGVAGGKGSNHTDARVEIHLRVPAAVASFRARTMNGELRAKGLHGEATLHTMNGAIDVEASGPIRATTMNGKVEAHAAAGSRVHLETMNGQLVLWLPANAGADVDAATTAGRIRSDFGSVPPPTLPAIHAATFTIGAGGTPVKLHTTHGDVSVRKL